MLDSHRNCIWGAISANPQLSRHKKSFSATILGRLVMSFFYFKVLVSNRKLPWFRRSRIRLQCRKPGFDPWVRKIPWRRKWQPTPVFLPGEFHGQRSLVGYSSWGCKFFYKVLASNMKHSIYYFDNYSLKIYNATEQLYV